MEPRQHCAHGEATSAVTASCYCTHLQPVALMRPLTVLLIYAMCVIEVRSNALKYACSMALSAISYEVYTART
jgi:hypothetical protein